MSELLRHPWRPSHFVERVQALDSAAFLDAYGVAIFLLVAIRGDEDPLVPGLAVRSHLLERRAVTRSVPPTGFVTHTEAGAGEEAAGPIVPASVVSEPHFIVLVHPTAEGAERVVLGRSSQADIVLRHASVSKAHAALHFDQVGAIGLSDLGSKNGTFLMDERIDRRVDVTSGDELRLGSVRATLLDAPALYKALRLG